MKNASQYSLSISDLIMGFLFIFILLLMKFMLEYDTKKKELLLPLEERAKLLKDMKKEIEKKNIQVEIDEKNGVLKLKSLHYFTKGKYELNSKGKKDFNKIKDIFEILICYSDPEHTQKKIRKTDKDIFKKYEGHYKEDERCRKLGFRNKYAKYCDRNKKCNNKQSLIDSILIEGHADSTPIGEGLKLKGVKTNIDLAMRRSQTVFSSLTDYKEATKKSKEDGNYLYFLSNRQGKPLFE